MPFKLRDILKTETLLDIYGGRILRMDRSVLPTYGFIGTDIHGYYFHRSSYWNGDAWGFGRNPPHKNMEVTFNLMETPKGKVAFNVRPK